MAPRKTPKKKITLPPQSERDAKRANALRLLADKDSHRAQDLRVAATILENGGPRALGLYRRLIAAEALINKLSAQLFELVGPFRFSGDCRTCSDDGDQDP